MISRLLLADKVAKVKAGHMPPFRPTTASLDCPAAMISLIERCWAENPHDRPGILEVKSAVKKASGLR